MRLGEILSLQWGISTWKDQGLVFSNSYGGYFDRVRLHTLFKRVSKDAGLPHMRFHDLPHSAATILLSMGVPAKVVQEVLGQSKINTTLDIYGHVLSEMQREAMDKMGDFFGEEL
jgi:integrase